jgi:uncharacterized protein (TIGR02271 family)
MTSEARHDHPGGDVPHRHNDNDELAVHGSASNVTGARPSEEQVLELREEELRARKETVQTGEVRVGKDVVEERQSLEVPVSRDEVTIERHPVDRRPAEGSIAEESATIRVPVREEQVSVEKRTVVTDEINVGTRKVQDTERVSDTVRREEARVESEGDVETNEQR